MPTIVRVAHFDIDRSRSLGEGGFGKVFFAKDISEDPPGEIAAKQVAFGAAPEADLRREVGLMRMVSGHRSVIGFHHFEQVADHEVPEVRLPPEPEPDPRPKADHRPHAAPGALILVDLHGAGHGRRPLRQAPRPRGPH